MNSLVLGAIIGIIICLKLLYPRIKGKLGEAYIAWRLERLDPRHYRVLNDLLLPSRGNLPTTQIDHILVSNYGIFCIETKAYKGWIFGSAEQEQWTQVIYRSHFSLYNPLRQNYSHVKAIEELVRPQFPNLPIIPYIVFLSADKLKISGTDSVGYTGDLMRKIRSYSQSILSDTDRDTICNILIKSNIEDGAIRAQHGRGAHNLKDLNQL